MEMTAVEKQKTVVTGATGYIGGRLLPILEKLGYPVRCLTRHASSLDGLDDNRRLIVEGDVLDPSTLPAAMADIDTAFYFVHSMGSSADFEEQDRQAALNFSTAAKSAGEPQAWRGVRFGSRLVDSRTSTAAVAPHVAFAAIQRIGGKNGWYYGNWMWSVRGFLDLLVGGVGLRRGRPHPTAIRVGDTLDFWRVEAFEPDHFLRLRAEMKLPGRAWLEFEVTGDQAQSTIRQTASFDPVGLAGIVYWYSVSPAHHFVFGGMLRNLVKAVEER